MSAALAGCNGETGSIDYSNDNTYKDPLKNPAPAGCTVSYKTGNGNGNPPKPQVITKDNPIELPDAAGLEAPEEGMVFVGWNDGLLTYPPEYQYTVTKNVTFNARWAFTTLGDITTHLTEAGIDAPVLIAVSGGEAPKDDPTALTWKNLLAAIETAGKADKFVELDLTGSALALFGDDNNEFDYKDNGSGYGTGEKYIKKLVLPSAATLIKTNFDKDTFLSLEAASGLNVSAIPANAFNTLPKLAAVVFPAAETIGSSAFINCYELTSVSLPAAESINDNSAFNGCYRLTEISLDKVTYIGAATFYNCTALTSVSLPAAGTIGNSAFSNCYALTSVSAPAATLINGPTFQNCYTLTSASMPAAGTINTNTFQNCLNLTSVSLPAAALINSSAFANCYVLTNINIAGSCTIDDATIRGGFKDYYNGDNGYDTKAAGVYTYSSQSWSYTPPK